jgi:hypothetical protein
MFKNIIYCPKIIYFLPQRFGVVGFEAIMAETEPT